MSPLKHNKEIGSDFSTHFDLLFSKNNSHITKDGHYLSSGRDCLVSIIKSIGRNRGGGVLLPSFLCEAILKPFQELGVEYSFYKINSDLTIDFNHFQKEVNEKNVSMLLLINYFGFPQPKIKEIKKLCNENKVILIEDVSHSFLSTFEMEGNFIFGSYRKMLPVPEGAFLIDNENMITKSIKKSPQHLHYSFIRSLACILKNFHFLKFIYRPLFLKSEKKLVDSYPKPAEMSSFSKFVLKRINLKQVRARRRTNFSYLLNNFKTKKLDYLRTLYNQLPETVCPLGFPVIFSSKEKRDKVRRFLIKNKVYCPIHWDIPKDVSKKEFKESWQLSEVILTIPIDQRYNYKDMNRIINLFEMLP